jgi:exopolyphosphatase/guanosine-5'-triphosphate,3'-diphosphate pyrophosphatase
VVPIGDEKVMILDVGGGSNEFIIANKDGVLWKHSFDLGIARLLDRFQPSNPITKEEVAKVEEYIQGELKLLYEAYEKYPCDTLIGSSGSFDTISGMIAAIHHPHLDMKKVMTYHIPLEYISELHNKFLQSTHEEREKMERMDLHRVEMIVLASIFINFIVREFKIKSFWQCSFALKEGTIYQILRNQL